MTRETLPLWQKKFLQQSSSRREVYNNHKKSQKLLNQFCVEKSVRFSPGANRRQLSLWLVKLKIYMSKWCGILKWWGCSSGAIGESEGCKDEDYIQTTGGKRALVLVVVAPFSTSYCRTAEEEGQNCRGRLKLHWGIQGERGGETPHRKPSPFTWLSRCPSSCSWLAERISSTSSQTASYSSPRNSLQSAKSHLNFTTYSLEFRSFLNFWWT